MNVATSISHGPPFLILLCTNHNTLCQ